MRGLVGLLLGLTVSLAGCGGGADPVGAGPSTAQAERLPSGKADLAVSGRYTSPERFAPEITLEVPQGWNSVHRGADGFDLGRPDPNRDAPLVAVVVLSPAQPTAREA